MGTVTEKDLFALLEMLVNVPAEQIRREWLLMPIINQEVVKFLRMLKGDYRVVLCTNASASLLRTILKDNNIQDLFDELIISSEIGLSKPDPQFFEKVLAVTNTTPEKMIFIDDSPVNVESAKKLGIQAFVFDNLLQFESLFVTSNDPMQHVG